MRFLCVMNFLYFGFFIALFTLQSSCFALDIFLPSERASQILKIQVKDAESETMQVGIYNVIGKLVATQSLQAQAEIDLDLRILPSSGVYFFKIHSGPSTCTRRFIKN